MKQIKNKKSLYTFLGILAVISSVIFFPSCSMDDTSLQPEGNYVSGYAIFMDTNFMHSGGYYAVALYPANTSLFNIQPSYIKEVDMSKGAPYYFRISCSEQANFNMAIVWVNSQSPGSIPAVLGTLGCDTSTTCHEHTVVPFPNFSGNDYNIRCWADPAHRLN